jgi:hypothetical protein
MLAFLFCSACAQNAVGNTGCYTVTGSMPQSQDNHSHGPVETYMCAGGDKLYLCENGQCQ